jgi:hypothetical protein
MLEGVETVRHGQAELKGVGVVGVEVVDGW